VQHNITVDPVSMAPYPPNGATFGRHQLGGLDLDSLKVDGVLHGPNMGYFYVKDAVRMLPSKIFVHPALYIGGLLPSTMVRIRRAIPTGCLLPVNLPFVVGYVDAFKQCHCVLPKVGRTFAAGPRAGHRLWCPDTSGEFQGWVARGERQD
jgi:hypothetical protein